MANNFDDCQVIISRYLLVISFVRNIIVIVPKNEKNAFDCMEGLLHISRRKYFTLNRHFTGTRMQGNYCFSTVRARELL